MTQHLSYKINEKLYDVFPYAQGMNQHIVLKHLSTANVYCALCTVQQSDIEQLNTTVTTEIINHHSDVDRRQIPRASAAPDRGLYFRLLHSVGPCLGKSSTDHRNRYV